MSTPSPTEQSASTRRSRPRRRRPSRGARPRAAAARRGRRLPPAAPRHHEELVHAVEVDRVQLRSNAGANRHAALQTRARVTRAAAAAAGELRDRQDLAHAASLGGLQLGGWRLGHHLANIQLEIIAPTLLFRRGGHVRDRRGRRRGQNAARVRMRRRLAGSCAHPSAAPRDDHLFEPRKASP